MSHDSPKAVAFRQRVEGEARFLETCDGGDPGSAERPSIWLLGIEPGWSKADEAAGEQRDREALDRYSAELQLKWPYNRNAFKLLAALEGRDPGEYRDFALAARPFERGSTGYFKGNLFPEPFNNVGEWDAEATATTGFPTKEEYRAWLRGARFAVMQAWIERCRPRLVIGTGLSNLADFLAVTGTAETPPAYRFEVNGSPKRMYVAKTGTVPVAIIPHLSGGPHGLNSDEAIRIAAARILDALE